MGRTPLGVAAAGVGSSIDSGAMGAEDLSDILASAQHNMMVAAAAVPPQRGDGAEGRDSEDAVTVWIDGTGVLENISFAPEISELSHTQLAEVTMEAINAAYAAARGDRAPQLPDLDHSEVDARMREALGMTKGV